MYRPGQLIILLFLSSLWQSSSFAQQQIGMLYGRILESATGEELPGVHVYLAGTQKGVVSDTSGSFVLQGITPGDYQLVATSIGYEKRVTDLSYDGLDSLFVTVELKRAIYAIDAITVEATADRAWRKNFRRFQEYFLGRSPNASKCKIQNPYTLDFTTTPLSLEATANNPLIIINEALGYRITFSLTHYLTSELGFRYRGEPFFEALETENVKDQERWVSAREKAYNGSILHFLRASAQGTEYDEGFRTFLFDRSFWRSAPSVFQSHVMRMNAGVEMSDLLTPDENGYTYTMDFDGFLHIVFENERVDRDFVHDMQLAYKNNGAPQISVLESTEGPVVFNQAGYFNAIYSLARYGYWNWESGICDLLPYDYNEAESDASTR